MNVLQREAAREAVVLCVKELQAGMKEDLRADSAVLARVHQVASEGGRSMAAFVAEMAAAFGGQSSSGDHGAEVAFAVLPGGDLWIGSDSLLVPDAHHLAPFCSRAPHAAGRRGGVESGFDASFWLSDAPHVVTENLSFQFDTSSDGIWGYKLPRWRDPSLLSRPPKATVESLLSSPPRTEIHLPLRDRRKIELPELSDAEVVLAVGLAGMAMWRHDRPDEVFKIVAQRLGGGTQWIEVRGGVWYDAAKEAKMREERAVWAKEKHKIKLIIHNTELEMKVLDDFRIARASSSSSSSSSSSGRRAMLADEEAKQEQSARVLSEAKRMLTVVEECEKNKEQSVFDLVRKYWVETGEDGSGVAIPSHELDAKQRRVYSHPCCKDAVEDSPALSFMLKSSWGSPRGAISCAKCLIKCFSGCPCREVSLLLGRTLSSLKAARGVAADVIAAALPLLAGAECVILEGGQGCCLPSQAVLRPQGLPEDVLSASEIQNALGVHLGDPIQLNSLPPEVRKRLGMSETGAELAVKALGELYRSGGDSRRKELVSRGGSWFSSLFGYLKQAIHREGDAVLKALAHVPIIPVWGHGTVSKDHQYTGGEALRVMLACGGGRVMLRPGLEGGDEEWSFHTLVDSGAVSVALEGPNFFDRQERGSKPAKPIEANTQQKSDQNAKSEEEVGSQPAEQVDETAGWGEGESVYTKLGVRVGGGWGMASWLVAEQHATLDNSVRDTGCVAAGLAVAIRASEVMGTGASFAGRVKVNARDGSLVPVDSVAVSTVYGIPCPWCPTSRDFAEIPVYRAPSEERARGAGDVWWEAGMLALGAKPHLARCTRAWWWACLAEGWGGQCPICMEELTAPPAEPRGSSQEEGHGTQESSSDQGSLKTGSKATAEGQGGGVVMLRGCRHAYHEVCISKWLARSEGEADGGGARCPMCREQVPSNPSGGKDATYHMERPSEGSVALRERLKTCVLAAKSSPGWGKGGWAVLAGEEGGAHILQRLER